MTDDHDESGIEACMDETDYGEREAKPITTSFDSEGRPVNYPPPNEDGKPVPDDLGEDEIRDEYPPYERGRKQTSHYPTNRNAYCFEIAIPFRTEQYRSSAVLPDWLNPWRYLLKRRMGYRFNSSDKQERYWKLYVDNTHNPPSFRVNFILEREGNDEFIYEKVVMLTIFADVEGDARRALENSLNSAFDEYTINPFEDESAESETIHRPINRKFRGV